MEKGRTKRLKGRYIPDNRILKHEPSGIVETPVGNGMTALTTEPLDVVCIVPRPIRKKRKSIWRKIAILMSAVMLPVMFVALADVLVVNAGLFFGTFAAAVGWPAFLVWANVRD